MCPFDKTLLSYLSPSMSTAHKLILDDSESDVNVYNEELWLNEIFWRDHYDWLKSKGYLLRPRYHPD
ncbi:hypothetical protein EV361DRAFT_585149 [Lentinula raphanica]|nr:hypothetical protein F5880DRAFT_70826 [Lentinula raphanica]KAJ3974895.1 hypothetical protein EV361DRAFT_585149 [Lentinula raphanica]